MRPAPSRPPEPISGSSDPAPAVLGALTCLSLSTLMPSLDTSIANVALPTLAHAFAASFHQIQWVVLSYLLVVTTQVVSAGRLGDLVGHRRLLEIGIGLFTGASLLCGLAPTFWVLIAARSVQGIGAAIMLSLTVALIGDTVPRERAGRAMGVLGTMSAVGTMLGPSLGGLLMAAFGWRVLFLVNVPVGLATALLARRYLPHASAEARAQRSAFDPVGTILLALTLGAYALAMTVGGGVDLRLLAATVLGAGLFAAAEARVDSPLIRLRSLRDGPLSASLVMNVVVAAVMMTTLVVGPFYLSRGLGLREAWLGVVMAAGPAISIACGVWAGRIVDRVGARPILVAGLAEMAIGALALSILPARLGLVGWLAAIVILTPGYQLFQAGNGTAVMLGVPPAERGVSAGLLGLSRNLGLVTGAAMMGAVFARATGAADPTAAPAAAVTTGLRVTFEVAASVLAAAAVAAALGSRRGGVPSPRATTR